LGSPAACVLNIHTAVNSIEYAVDINPRKHLMFVAGTGQPIVPPSFLQGYQPDILLVMNPFYADEIAQLADCLGLKTELLTV
jgi:C-methyltransferase C-terminal domain